MNYDLQGRFTATGNAVVIALPNGVDWMEVTNFTEATTPVGSHGVTYYWQRGLADNNGFVTLRNAGATADIETTSAALTVGGFTYVDSSINIPSAPIAVTGVSAANPPVVLTATTTSISLGDIVRLSNLLAAGPLPSQAQASTMDFIVTAINPGVSFSIGTINLSGTTASTAGFWRRIPYQPMFYPPRRYITFALSVGNNTRLSLSVTHQYTVGQKVRLNFEGGSVIWGDWAQLNGLEANIIAINTTPTGNEPAPANGLTSNITVDINSASLAAWLFAGTTYYPPVSLMPFTPAAIVPIGETANASILDSNGNPLNPNLLDDSMRNTAIIGMNLAAGITSPAGTVGQVVYWRAGTSYNVNNL